MQIITVQLSARLFHKCNKVLFCGKSSVPELQLDRLAKLVTILTRTSLCCGTLGSWRRFDRLSTQPLIVHYLTGQEYLQSALHYIVANFGDTFFAEPSGQLNIMNYLCSRAWFCGCSRCRHSRDIFHWYPGSNSRTELQFTENGRKQINFTDILGDSEWDKHSHKKVVVVFKVKSPASELCFELCCCHKVVLSREAAVGQQVEFLKIAACQ